MYLLPQEVEVWYIIPKIRKEMSSLLVSKHEWSYEKTGDALGISKAAVCQYIKNKRANKIKLSKEIQKELEESVELIADKKSNGLLEIQRLLKLMRDSKCSCGVCKTYNKDVLKYCNCDGNHP